MLGKHCALLRRVTLNFTQTLASIDISTTHLRTSVSHSSLHLIHITRMSLLLDWLAGDHLLLRDFGPYGIIFTTVFTTDFTAILGG
jgi:hypothetical protein